MVCTFWHENLWSCYIIGFPILWITQVVHLSSRWIWLVKGLFFLGGGIKNGIFMCIISFDCLNLKHQRVIRVHFFLIIAHLSCFKDPMNKSQHWEKWTQNNPFIGLRRLLLLLFLLKLLLILLWVSSTTHVVMSTWVNLSIFPWVSTIPCG